MRFISGRGGLGASRGLSTGSAIRTKNNLDDLARGLGDLSEALKNRLVTSSIRDALSPAHTVAKKQTVHKGGFDQARPSLSARTKRGITRKMIGKFDGQIKSVNNWPRLYNWAQNRSTTANYTSKGSSGVRYRGLFRNSGKIFKPRYAFVRKGKNGNAMVFGREDDSRDSKLFGFYGPNPSHVMLHKPVREAVEDKFTQKLDERFVSKYQGAIDSIKSRHGL